MREVVGEGRSGVGRDRKTDRQTEIWLGRNVGVDLERVGGEYDQNVLHEIFIVNKNFKRLA